MSWAYCELLGLMGIWETKLLAIVGVGFTDL